MRSGYLVEDPGPGGAYYCSPCWPLKPQFERRSLILPLNPTAVNPGLTRALPCQETLETKAERRANLAQLRDLEAEMALVGVLEGPRWRGKKPKTA